jgi:iron complex outermembrane receptor protein
MKRSRPIYGFSILVLFAIFAPSLIFAQTARVEGQVTDAITGAPLPGANVMLLAGEMQRQVGGAATDIDGVYRLSGIPADSYVLVVRFVGYTELRRSVDLEGGETATVDVALESSGIDLEQVVISASRQQEKVLDAPASISILDTRDLEHETAPSSVETLRNTSGVDMAQTGIDRREVVLRGFNNAFSGATYTLTDYRHAAVPSLGVNIYSIMPNMSIDLERVEVVRGPGSALYGAGVDNGVIHFITKDPFTYPGTTVSLLGGSRSLKGGELRHAGIVSDRLGYKITGSYVEAVDWELDPDDPVDMRQIENDGGRRDTDYRRYTVNGLVQYRFADGVRLTANGGYGALDATVLSGIGTVRGEGFGYSYGQLRLRAGDFFAQGYFNKNNAGDSFVYGTGQAVVDRGVLYNLQAQYDFDTWGQRQRFIVGADAEFTRPETEGRILGRNEDRDNISEIGGYVQSSTTIAQPLTLTMALRTDYNNVFEEVQLSPRAALVYRPHPTQSLRVSYNHAFSSPTTNSLFLDITAREVTFEPTPYRLMFQGRGSADGFTFDEFQRTNTVRFSLPVQGFFGNDVPLGSLPLVPVYGVAASELVPRIMAGDVLTNLTEQQRQLIAQLMGHSAQVGSLGSAATDAAALGLPDDSDRGYRSVSGPIEIPSLKQTTSQTFEIGYKGLVADRFIVAVDGYYTRKENFVSGQQVVSPLAYLQQDALTQDMVQALSTSFSTSNDPIVQNLLQQLEDTGLPSAQVPQLLGGLTGAALADTPAGVVQPDQPVLPPGTENAVGAFAAYRNFGSLAYWGADISVDYLVLDVLSVFANASWVSDDFFDYEDLSETNEDLFVALNAPQTKLKGGVDYRPPEGFSFSMSGRFVKGFPVASGAVYIGGLPEPYGDGTGGVEDYFLLDLGAGYAFERHVPGLRLDAGVRNLLDNEHREFVGAPRIGRFASIRLTYDL